LDLIAFVIMSNHIHLLTRSSIGDLSGTIRDFKNYTSRKFLEIVDNKIESRNDWMKMVFQYQGKFKNKQINQIWTHENHAEQIYSQKFLEQKIEYIHNNPVRAGIVERSEDYLYSSARNYAGLVGVIDILKADILWKRIE